MSADHASSLAPLNAHALLIQVSKYVHRPLPEVFDAVDIAEVLKDSALCGYPPDQVRVLHDHAATRAEILAQLRRLVAAADAEATVVFYFSGHGGQLGDVTYLLPFDAVPEQLSGTALSAQELAKELAPLRAQKVLLIFDCCHSGGFEAKDAYPVQLGLSAAAQDALLQGRGWALFAAADQGESSYVRHGARNGVFTKHLLAGLRGGRPSEDGHVRVFSLFEYLQPQVSAEFPAQHPIFKCSLNENFAVARHRGGAIAKVERTEDDFFYHVLLCYAKADAAFVHNTLLPRLHAAGMRVATTNTVGEPGLDRVIGLERGLEQSRRTLVIVSPAFLRRDNRDDKYADHLVLQSKHADIVSGRYSLVPVYVADPDALLNQPSWLANLQGVKLGAAAANAYVDEESEMTRLMSALARPVPRR